MMCGFLPKFAYKLSPCLYLLKYAVQGDLQSVMLRFVYIWNFKIGKIMHANWICITLFWFTMIINYYV